jgi:hypothetical protein
MVKIIKFIQGSVKLVVNFRIIEVANGPERIAIALKRGKEVNVDLVLGINYFDYAHEPLEDLRKRWNIPAK